MPAHTFWKVPVVCIGSVAVDNTVFADISTETCKSFCERLLEFVVIVDEGHKALHTLKLGAVVCAVCLVWIGCDDIDVPNNLVVLYAENNILEVRTGLECQ